MGKRRGPRKSRGLERLSGVMEMGVRRELARLARPGTRQPRHPGGLVKAAEARDGIPTPLAPRLDAVLMRRQGGVAAAGRVDARFVAAR